MKFRMSASQLCSLTKRVTICTLSATLLLSPISISQADQNGWQADQVIVNDEVMTLDELEAKEPSPLLKSYIAKRKEESTDINGHRRLAKWCHGKGLDAQANAHWNAVAGLSYDDIEARTALKHINIGGRWFTADEVELAKKQRKEANDALREWKPEVESIVKQLQSSDSKSKLKGFKSLEGIKNSEAIYALQWAAQSQQESIALPIIEKIKSIRAVESCQALLTIALQDPNSKCGESALEGLAEYDLHFYVPQLLQLLELPPEFRQELVFFPNGSIVVHQRLIQEGQFGKQESEIVKVMAITDNPREGQVLGMPGARNEVALKVPMHPQASDAFTKLSRMEMEKTEDQIAEEKRRQEAAQARIRQVLHHGLEVSTDATPQEMWMKWSSMNDQRYAPKKPVLVRRSGYNTQDSSYVPTTTSYSPAPNARGSSGSQFQFVNIGPSSVSPFASRASSCLVAGTMIQTDNGMQAIESLSIGDLVVSVDTASGETSLKPVILKTVREECETTFTVQLADEMVQATAGHYWWVVDRGWMRTRELQVGMSIQAASGSVAVASIDASAPPVSVYNCIVEGNHTYLVGKNRLLSWDVTELKPQLVTSIPQPEKLITKR
jgi:hypothetical protein